MNKEEFVKYLTTRHSITQEEANQAIDMFTSSVTSALAGGDKVSAL